MFRNIIPLGFLPLLVPPLFSQLDSFTGIYTGGFSGAGSGFVAILAQPDNTAFLAGFEDADKVSFSDSFTVGSDGSFTFTIASGAVSGSVGENGISGTVTDGAIPFSGTRESEGGPEAEFSGLYAGLLGEISDSSLEAILTAGGAIYFILETPTFQDGGMGPLNEAGEFSLTGSEGTTFSGSLDTISRIVSGMFKNSEGSGDFILKPFPPLPSNVRASQGSAVTDPPTVESAIRYFYDKPDTPPKVKNSIYAGMTPDFADAFRFTGVLNLNASEAGARTGIFTGDSINFTASDLYRPNGCCDSLNSLIRAPKWYFWVVFTQDGISTRPAGPGMGFSALAEPVATIFWHGSDGMEAPLDGIEEGAPLGPAQLNAYANVPGVFTYDPPEGTILPPGVQELSVTLTPVFPEFEPLTRTVRINVAGQPSNDAFGGLLLGEEFFFSPWYGIYNVSFYPWVFHNEHGWQYVFETETAGEVFLFDLESQDFWWTSSAFTDNFFTFYSFNRGTFNFYFESTSNPRQFVDLETTEFYSIPTP